MKINLTILLSFFYLILTEVQYITIPFEIIYFNESTTDIVELQRRIIVQVESSFGSKKEKFKLACDLDSSAIVIPDVNCPLIKNKNIKKFDIFSSSDTFEMVTNITSASSERFYTGIEGKDDCQLGSYNNKIKFIVVDYFTSSLHEISFNYAFLGLNYDVIPLILKNNGIHSSIIKFQGFFDQLKENNLVSHKSWYLDFNSDKKGKLVIGALPHEIDNNTFPEDSKQSFISNYIYTMEFDEIYFGKIDEYDKRKTTEKKNILFSLSRRVMECTQDFWNYINKFFEDKKDICKPCDISNYEYYYCYKDKFNMQEMDNVNFYIKEKEFTFVFEPKNLFYEKDNKLYYLIIHKKELNEETFRWNIGTLFFEKYTIAFNKENKEKIVYMKKSKPEENDETPKSTYIIIIVVLSVFLVASIAIFIFYLIKIKPRKKKANELDEDFDYQPKDNEKGETPILDE